MKNKLITKKIGLMPLILILAVLPILVNMSVFANEVGSWANKADMPTARLAVTAVELEGEIYAIGGWNGAAMSTVEKYNPSTNTWTTKPSMTSQRHTPGVASVNGKIYAIGGFISSSTNTVEEYDPATNTWTPKANMQYARQAPGVAVVDGKIYVIGGCYNGDVNGVNSVEEYNPLTDTWTTKASMPTARGAMGAVAVNGKIYAIGGGRDNGAKNHVEVYDPSTDTWTTKTSMPTARWAIGAAAVGDIIYVMGGWNDGILSITEAYDTVADTWSTKASMPISTYYHGVAEANGKIYSVGGYPGISTTLEYTPPVTAPNAPANLIATSGDAQVNLGWNAVSNATSYNIKRSTISGGQVTIDSVTAPETNYTDLSVSNGITYYYVVTAVNEIGESISSNEVSATPQANAPNAPTNLIATAGDAQVNLTWSTVYDATSYNIKRSTNSGGQVTIDSVSAPGTTYTDLSVSNDITYYYVVTAVNEGGESTVSNEVYATPKQLTNIRALLIIDMVNGTQKEYDLNISELDVFLNWHNNSTGNAYYVFDKNYNLGPFLNRKDYLIFDKIVSFEVMEYVTQ